MRFKVEQDGLVKTIGDLKKLISYLPNDMLVSRITNYEYRIGDSETMYVYDPAKGLLGYVVQFKDTKIFQLG